MAVIALLVALVLAACGGPQPTQALPTPQPAAAPVLPTPTSVQPTATQPLQPGTPTPFLSPTRSAAVAPPSNCPHTPLGGFYDVWRNAQVWPRLGCAVEAAMPIGGTDAHLCCELHSIWIQDKRLFVALDESNSRWAFVADGSGLPADATFVIPTLPVTPEPPLVTPVPTPAPTGTTTLPIPLLTQPSATPAVGATTPLPTVELMTRLYWSPSEPCFRASGRHAWLATLPPWSEKCRGLSSTNETVFHGAMERFEGGWLLWNGNLCFVLFADGTWVWF